MKRWRHAVLGNLLNYPTACRLPGAFTTQCKPLIKSNPKKIGKHFFFDRTTRFKPFQPRNREIRRAVLLLAPAARGIRDFHPIAPYPAEPSCIARCSVNEIDVVDVPITARLWLVECQNDFYGSTSSMDLQPAPYRSGRTRTLQFDKRAAFHGAVRWRSAR